MIFRDSPEPLIVVGSCVVNGEEDADRVFVVFSVSQLQVSLDVDVEGATPLGGDAVVAETLGLGQLRGGHRLLVVVTHPSATKLVTNDILMRFDKAAKLLCRCDPIETNG